jgi:uncharacterized protein (TIRG00374 family)
VDSTDTDSVSGEFPPHLPKEKIYRGLRYFAILTVLGLAILFYATATRKTLEALGHLDVQFLLLAAALKAIDIGVGAWRTFLLVRRVKPGISPTLCVRGQLANEFGAAATPGQSGGGPAWLYVLYRGGVPVAGAVATSVLVFQSTLVFFMVATFTALSALDVVAPDRTVFALFQYGFLLCAALFCTLFLSLWKPQVIEGAIEAVVRHARRKAGGFRDRVVRWGEGLEGSIHRYSESGLMLWREHRSSVLSSFLMTVVYYLNRLNLSYFLLRGLGLDVDYLTALAILALLRFALYFMPTPGGSGIGEITIAALMSAVIPTCLLPIYAVLYRAFHLFLPATLGAWVLISELKKAGKEEVTHPPDR